MVVALVNLYNLAGGEQWINQTNWLEGEPCINGWYGVICCPLDFPRLAGYIDEPATLRCYRASTGRRRRRLAASPLDDAIATASVASSAPPQSPPHGHRQLQVPDFVSPMETSDPSVCSTGVIYGNASDYATCAVVGLALESNGLTGAITAAVLPPSYPPADQGDRGDRGLRDLQFLDVSNNQLSGPLPAGLLALRLE